MSDRLGFVFKEKKLRPFSQHCL